MIIQNKTVTTQKMEGRFTWEVEWMDLVTGWVRKVMEMTLRFCSCMKEYILILQEEILADEEEDEMLTFESRSEASGITSILYSIHAITNLDSYPSQKKENELEFN